MQPRTAARTCTAARLPTPLQEDRSFDARATAQEAWLVAEEARAAANTQARAVAASEAEARKREEAEAAKARDQAYEKECAEADARIAARAARIDELMQRADQASAAVEAGRREMTRGWLKGCAQRAWGDAGTPTAAPKVYSLVGKSAAEVGSLAATAVMQSVDEAIAFDRRVL